MLNYQARIFGLLPILIPIVVVFMVQEMAVGVSTISQQIYLFVGLGVVISINIWMLRKTSITETNIDYQTQHPNDKAKNTIAIFFVTFIFMANCFRYYDLFPFTLAGESNNTAFKAELISQWVSKHILWLQIARTYNLGFGLLYAPLQSLMGVEPNEVKKATIFIWAIMVGLLAWVFTYRQKKQWLMLLLLTPVLLSSTLLMCIRTYKWHAVAAMASVSLYLIVHKYRDANGVEKRNPLIVTAGILMLSLSIIMYQPTIAFIPILLLIFMADTNKAIFLKNKKTIFFLLMGIFLLGVMLLTFGSEQYDIVRRVGRVIATRGDGVSEQRKLYSYIRIYFTQGVSTPLSAMLLIGICVGFQRFFSDWFARAVIIQWVSVSVMMGLTYGAVNMDENNYIVVSLCALMFLGVREVYERCLLISRGAVITSFLLLLAIVVGINEANYYYYTKNGWLGVDGVITPWGSHMSAIFLADIAKKITEDDSLIIFFPSKQASYLEGGFPEGGALNKPTQWQEQTLSRTKSYTSVEELQEKITALTQTKPDNTILVYYCPSDKLFDSRLLAKTTDKNALSVKAPYPEVWSNKLVLTYVVYRGAGVDGKLPASVISDLNRQNEIVKETKTPLQNVEEFSKMVRIKKQLKYF